MLFTCKKNMLSDITWNFKFTNFAPTQVVSCEICKIFKNTLFYRTLPVGASDIILKL